MTLKTRGIEAVGLGWGGIVRLGLVQMAIGAMVVLTTSTLNRVMVVELALPAMLPGALVALHYLVQVLRPRMGWGSDVGGRRTPWIVGGLAVLAAGATGAAASVAWMATSPMLGIALAVLCFFVIGVGIAAAGTSLLVLLAQSVAPARRAPAATIVWMMMIVGFALTAGVAGRLLDPYSAPRLVAVMGGTCALAFAVAVLALRGLEPARRRPQPADGEGAPLRFRAALAEVWAEPDARRFTVFIFVSMLAYSAQDLILEPFAGSVFGFTPGQSTSLSGVQHGGVLLGMVAVALLGPRWGTLRGWTVGGCIASALALGSLVVAGAVGPAWPLSATVFVMGAANGAFSIAAIGSMMRLAGQGATGPEDGRQPSRMGTRMGLWGAAQAVAFGAGGMAGTAASDLAHALLGSPAAAYASVFALEALLFVAAAVLALRIDAPAARRTADEAAAHAPLVPAEAAR